VAEVPGVLLEQVEQDPLQGRGVGAGPAVAGFADLAEIVGFDDGAGPPGLVEQVGHEAGQGLLGPGRPAAVGAVAPRVSDRAALEAPLEPAQLDIAQVLGQLQRRPAGREPAAAQLGGGQGLQLAGQPGPEVVQVAEEDLGARAGRGGRLGKRHGNGSPLLGRVRPLSVIKLAVAKLILTDHSLRFPVILRRVDRVQHSLFARVFVNSRPIRPDLLHIFDLDQGGQATMARYRLYPTAAQESVLMEHCAHARYVWNLAWNLTRSAKGTAERPGRNVRRKAGLNQAILAQGWGLLVRRTKDKAPGRAEKVRAAYTSLKCSACGWIDKNSRDSQAGFVCVHCGFTCNADHNAALTIAAGHAGGTPLSVREPLTSAA
jgi:predicted RNA-binding Zn-ribbon protein involved in translation (DUF1610 family)